MSSYYTTSDEDSMSPVAVSSLPGSPDSTCRVEILEEPMTKVRFRYLSELQGTPHGPLLGVRSTKSNKTFPKVRLVGYDSCEPVKMRCWLVDKAPRSLGSEIRPHCHDLVVRRNLPKCEIVCEPHEVTISRDNNYTAVFENMVVLHCVQKDSEMKYYAKENKWKARLQDDPRVKFDKKRIRDTMKCINKNEVYLYFEAYMVYRNNAEHILCSALSNPIKNLKNPVSGDLKICRVVNGCGSTDGNTEVALFTEKIPPDVKIKFSDDSGWEELVNPECTHRNLALTFKSPPYPCDIDSSHKVKFCLYRESDNGESNVCEFTYLPGHPTSNGTKKRKLNAFTDDAYLENGVEEVVMDNNQLFGGRIELIASCTDEGDVLYPKKISNTLLSSNLNLIELMSMDPVVEAKINENDPDNFAMINQMLNEKDSEAVSVNWSAGSTLEKLDALGSPDIVVGSTTGGAYDSDGILTCSYLPANKDAKPVTISPQLLYTRSQKVIKENSKYNIIKKKMGSIIMDILLTQKYSNHVNCLQQAVLDNKGQLVERMLTVLCKYLDLQNKSRIFQRIRLIRNDKYQTLLHSAVTLGYSDIVRILLKFGFDPGLHDMEGNNCYHQACTQPSRTVLQILTTDCLVTKKISETNANGLNVLHLSVKSNSLDVVRYIVDCELVSINSLDLNSGDTPLHLACRLRLYSVAQYLLQNGANMDAVNLAGFTPLQLSVDKNYYLLASLLISKKSDPLQECRSLVLEKEDTGEYDEDKLPTIEENSIADGDTNQLNAFALAHDIMMVNVLSGKISLLDLDKEDNHENKIKQIHDNKEGVLSSVQIEKLNILLSKDERWKILVKELKLEKFLPMITSGSFKEPVKVLLNFINRNNSKILGETYEDKNLNLINIFKKIKMEEAVNILSH